MSRSRLAGKAIYFVTPLTRLGGSTDFGDSKIVLDPRRSPVLGTRSSEPMHTIRANLYWEFQFVLGYIAVPRSRIGWKPFKGVVGLKAKVWRQ